MKITIHTDWRGHIIARNPDGIIIGSRNPYCNPAALDQLILDAELCGTIDWKQSTVAKPRKSHATCA